MEKKDSFVYTLLENGRAVYMGVSKRFRHSIRKCKLKGMTYTQARKNPTYYTQKRS